MTLTNARATRLIFLALSVCAGLCPAAEPAAAGREIVHRIPLRFHLVTDLPMEKSGVSMTPWITPEMIADKIMPEINRIWSAARIEFTLGGVSSVTTRGENRAEAIASLLQAKRDGEGRADHGAIKRLQSILKLKQEDAGVVNIYVIPYLGGTSQGCASPRQKRVMLGQWTDKPSRGKRPPEKCLLVERGDFKQGSFSRTAAHELGHILGLKHPDAPPLHRLMGGGNPGNELTDEEKALARKTAAALSAGPKTP